VDPGNPSVETTVVAPTTAPAPQTQEPAAPTLPEEVLGAVVEAAETRGETLPVTGGDAAALAVVSVVLVAGGTVLVVTSRRSTRKAARQT
jgi:hypothetical protein